ncbi:hypothetical protein [Fluviicola chungangensis]|uniref:Uncharacterized protein n=1 Tax=Fluviicola chungangensis TaxID=2597671 RepID=A0A556MZX4_9FLAO|nr:hypothetical protein [Fluviicola chungangensis]TSJ45471.1 hypothetical protein FO442_06870 [Fluviicola chungangensis]
MDFTFPGERDTEDRFLLSSLLSFSALGLLLTSWISKNSKVIRVLENSSLWVGAFFFRAFFLADTDGFTPIWAQLLFVISFGLFLYFKLMLYFSRDKENQK